MKDFAAAVRDVLEAIPTPLAVAGMLGLAAIQTIVTPDHATALAGNVVSALAGWLAHRSSSAA